MSHIATTWAWKQDVENPIRKLVLLFVADAANPERDWNTWHSFRTIAEACNCSIGSVSVHMKWLTEQNYLTLIRQGSSTRETNRYRLNVGEVTVQIGPRPQHCSTAEQLDRSAAEQYRSTAEHDRSAPERDRSSPVDKPVIEPVIEPVKEPVREPAAQEAKRSTLIDLPEWIPAQLWIAYLASRRSMKKHPMSPAALDLVVIAISKTMDAGWDIEEIMTAMIENGWRTVKPEFLENRKRQAPATDETNDERAKRLAREMFGDNEQLKANSLEVLP